MENNYEAYEYARLIGKYLKGELSSAEEVTLNSWLEENPENLKIVEKLQNEQLLKPELEFFSSIDQQKAWHTIKSTVEELSTVNKIYKFIQRWKFAAVALVTISLGALFFRVNHNTEARKPLVATQVTGKYKNDVPPGTEKANLTLTDGSVVAMDGHFSGTVKKYSGLKISINHGLVSYNLSSDNNRTNLYNTISTPVGGKYKVVLPDGSLVWLNSASSLKFPVAFSKYERKVYLTGEGYFEVAKNKHKPFKVFVNNTVVQVLGTHFNVAAYKNEQAVKTTLLEGSVKVTSNDQSKLIVPGEQATVNWDSSKIKINAIDVSETVAWKNNLFVFDNQEIESVMREVARWYNVDVEYQNAIPQTHFSGTISRNNNISQILNMLELTGGVHFSIDGRKVMVTK